MDVTTAFLNGILEEEIYMTQPEGRIVSGKEDKVCKLNRSLYGLKQSPRCWNQRIDTVLKEENFNQCMNDSAVYVKQTSEYQIILGIYVDDIVLLSTDLSELQKVKENYLRSSKWSILVKSARFWESEFEEMSLKARYSWIKNIMR